METLQQVNCPDPQTFTDLLLGRLDDEQAEPLEEHLLNCTKCASRAKTVNAHDSLVDAVQKYQPRRTIDDDPVQRIVQRLGNAEPAGRSAGDAASSVVVEQLNDDDGSLFTRLANILHERAGEVETPPGSQPAGEELYDFLAAPEQGDEIGRLGPYRILRVLGAGGMGVVFLAEDRQLQRHVALKAMHPALAASESARKRFMHEAQATAAIQHDHIITVHQVDTDRGIPYLTMALLQGQTLDARLAPGTTMPLGETLRIGRELAEGLAAAHQAGLIHRDIKPANIWLEEDTGRVKILDFGLARATQSDVKLTSAGTIVGTPGFSSPEQARGEEIDARSDLFSMGCVLYWMSTGEPPFIGADHAELRAAAATETPQPPRMLRKAIPPALSDLIMQMLAKAPHDRPLTAKAVAAALCDIELSDWLVEKPTAKQDRNSLPFTPLANRRLLLPVGVVLMLALVAIGWLWGSTVYHIVTDQGSLVIETDNDDVRVVIQQRGETVKIQDTKTGNSVTLKAGVYELRLGEKRPGLRLETDRITLYRGDRKIVHVRFDHSSPEPAVIVPATAEVPPLHEYLKGRELITVAQDGSGEFRTINEALEALRPGQVVEVLDRGPYRERLRTTLPADVGLVSQVGTQIEFADWIRTGVGFNDGAKSLYTAMHLTCPRGLRISGFTFRCPKVPEDAELVSGLVLSANGKLAIEMCIVVLDGEDLVLSPPNEISHVVDFRAIQFLHHETDNGKPTPDTELVVRENLLSGVTVVSHRPTTRMLFERNYVVGWPRSGVAELRPSREFVIRHNVIRAWKGISILGRTWESADDRKGDRYLIANNVFDSVEHSVYVWPSMGRVSGRMPYPLDVVIRNNVFQSLRGGGIGLDADDLPTVKNVWQVDHNCYSSAPQDLRQCLPVRKDRHDLIVPAPFLSSHPDAHDYARIEVDGQIATGGVGGDLPPYLGALPPGRAPAEGDWFSRLVALQQKAGTKPAQSVPASRAPDLSRITPLLDNEFTDAKTSRVGVERRSESFDRFFEGGRHVLVYKWDKPHAMATFPVVDLDQDFACEVVARAKGKETDGWGIYIIDAGERGIGLKLSRDGNLTLGGSYKNAGDFPGEKVAPISHKAIRPGGEDNRLLVVLQDGHLSLYVNAVAIANPIKLDPKFQPERLLLAARPERKDARAEFRRVIVWPAKELVLQGAK